VNYDAIVASCVCETSLENSCCKLHFAFGCIVSSLVHIILFAYHCEVSIVFSYVHKF